MATDKTDKEEKEKVKVRREKIAGYYLDMSKLAFASSVLGGFGPLFKDTTWVDAMYVILGLAATVIFAKIGNNILK